MKTSWFLLFAQRYTFWKLRNLLIKTIFKSETISYRIRFGLREEKDSTYTLISLISLASIQLLLAMLFSIGLQWLDHSFDPLYVYLNINIPEDGLYGNLFASVGAIGGVFIGLYYAGVSAIGSTIYSKVPNEVRNLLAKERIGYVYMRFLVFTTFISFCFISLRALGFPRIHIAVPLICILAGIGIIGFIRLGQRTFHLFDPSTLSIPVLYEINRNLQRVKADGFQWDDSSFQKHSREQAKSNFELLCTLANITSKEIHLSGRPYLQLIQKFIVFLTNYEQTKKKIPYKSDWYEMKYRRKEWYRSSDHNVTMALRIRGDLQPEVDYDRFWVENIALEAIYECLKLNLQKSEYENVTKILYYLKHYIYEVAFESDLTRAIDQIDKVMEIILKEITKAEEFVFEDENIMLLGIMDHISLMIIESFLKFVDFLNTNSIQEIDNKLSRVKWNSKSDLFNQNFPTFLLPRLEWLREYLQFEYSIEGQLISPPWYRLELISQVYSGKLKEGIESLVIKCAELFKRWIQSTDALNRPLLSCAIMSREWEYWHKVESHINQIINKWNYLYSNRRIAEMSWPEIIIDEINTKRIKQKMN
ncbi:MAG: hypothetical protein WD469_12740 [Paenibacillaceae bacterium]